MGTSMSVHVGPFVRIKLEPTTYVSNVKTCTKVTCNKHKRASIEKFCPECGSQIEQLGVELEGTIGWQEFLPLKDYKYEDELYNPDYLGETEEILLSNYAGGTHLDENGSVLTLSGEGIPNRMETDMGQFYKRHGTMLDEMKAFFGDKMSVEYGVVSYWS